MAENRSAAIAALLQGKARGRYGLHGTTQKQHAPQAARLAKQVGCDDALIPWPCCTTSAT